MTVALIDGDLAAYRAACVTQTDVDWDGDGQVVSTMNPLEAIKAAVATIKLWQEAADCEKLLVCLTGDGNFRKKVYPLYKSNRAGQAKPLALKQVQQAIRETFPTATVNGLEADDLLGLALTAPKAKGRAVCVSMDKDLRTVPGLHLNPSKEVLPVFVGEADANRFWMKQTLMGDACDGYPGCPGIGPKKADKILADWDGAKDRTGFWSVAAAFMDKGKFEHFSLATDAALQQARVARILRYGDYDKVKRRVKLWHPTGLDEFVEV